MKLTTAIRKMFRKPLTIAEIMDIDDIMYRRYVDEEVVTIAGRTFKTLWMVSDKANGYRKLADGFTTKKEAREYADSIGSNAYFAPYVVEI